MTTKLNETEISNISGRDCKVMAIKIFTGLRKRVEDLKETFNTERKFLKELIKDEELNN